MVSQHNWTNTRTYTDKNIIFPDKNTEKNRMFPTPNTKISARSARSQSLCFEKTVDSRHRPPTRALWEILTGELQLLSLLTIKFAGLFLLKTKELPGATPPGPPAHGPTRKGTRANARCAVRVRKFPVFFIIFYSVGWGAGWSCLSLYPW